MISNALEKLNVSYCFKIPFDFNYFMDVIKRVFSDETKINETHVNETEKIQKVKIENEITEILTASDGGNCRRLLYMKRSLLWLLYYRTCPMRLTL